MACGILAPQPRIKATAPAMEAVSTTGPPGESLDFTVLEMSIHNMLQPSPPSFLLFKLYRYL